MNRKKKQTLSTSNEQKNILHQHDQPQIKAGQSQVLTLSPNQ